MRYKRKAYAVGICILLIVQLILLEGCQAVKWTTDHQAVEDDFGKKYISVSNEQTPEMTAEAEGELEGKTLVIWTWDQKQRYEIAKMLQFEEQSGAKIDFHIIPYGEYFTRLRAAISSQTQVDVVYMPSSSFPLWGICGDLLPLSDYLEPDHPAFSKPISEFYTWNGKVYGVNANPEATVLLYNRELFARAGLSTPLQRLLEGEWTWDEFISDARSLTVDRDEDGEIEQWGSILEQECWEISNGVKPVEVIDNTPVFGLNSPAGYGAYNMRLYYQGLKVSSDSPRGKALMDFMEGSVAMYFGRTDRMDEIIDLMGDKVDFVPFPVGPEGEQPVTLLEGNAWMIPSNSKDPELSAAFIQFINSQAFAERENDRLRRILGDERFVRFQKYRNEYGAVDEVRGWGLNGIMTEMDEKILKQGMEPAAVIRSYAPTVKKFIGLLIGNSES